MFNRIKKQFASAVQDGSLVFTEDSLTTQLIDGSIAFQIKLCTSLAKKPQSSQLSTKVKKISLDPFMPCDDRLFVCEWMKDYNLVLNKFCVTRWHVLLVTRTFHSQFAPWTHQDCEAITSLLQTDIQFPLVFFNCGSQSGASILHKHVQIIPLESQTDIPIHSVVNKHIHKPPCVPFEVPELPFAHGLCLLPVDLIGSVLHNAFLNTLQFAMHSAGRDASTVLNVANDVTSEPPDFTSYSLIMTNKYILIVPRCCDRSGAISINSVGFSGMMLCKREEDLQFVASRGPLQILQDVSFTKNH